MDMSLWMKKLEERAQGTFWELLGCKAEAVSPERTVIALVAEKRHLNAMGIVHGGVLASLLDNAMGLAVMSAYPDKRTVTTNLNVHFVASLGPGPLRTTAKVLHETRTTLTVEASVEDASGKLGTIGTGSFRLLD
ncbi:PaaI family thioesterase [Paenibacillus antri]|uniref:PaaI family thioesterase n=1 Tax=Paenibacillus antri TaxID=2582848 RepID=A0A5R9G6S5_9BACL|nr:MULTISPECIES: PaaI family thioesterase [Paenibacillus]TLS52102.1 PaaI family thioesterase [Paenibacillus antri]